MVGRISDSFPNMLTMLFQRESRLDGIGRQEMTRIRFLAISGMAMVFAAPHAQAAQFDTGSRNVQSAPLLDIQTTSKTLIGTAEQRRGGARSGGGRGMRGGMRGGGRGMRSGGNRGFRGGSRGTSNRSFSDRGHFRGGRTVHRGDRGFRGDRNFRGRNFRGQNFRGQNFRGRHHRGRNFGLGFASGVFLGSALSYPRYSSYGYPTYGYPDYGYPSYGSYGGYDGGGYGNGQGHRHYHGRHCAHDRRQHGYHREY